VSGYTLTGAFTSITLGPAALINGPLVGGTAHAYTITSLGGTVAGEGTVAGGVTLGAGGTITNGTASGSTAYIGGLAGIHGTFGVKPDVPIRRGPRRAGDQAAAA